MVRPAHEILFATYSNGGPDGLGCCDRRLIVARPTGASRRTIDDDSDPEDGYRWASWSPDGKWIAYTYEVRTESYEGFGVIDVASGTTTPINFSPAIVDPVWAPDSSRFAIQLIYKGAVGVFSSGGRLLSAMKEGDASVVAWTRAGLYLEARSARSTKLVLLPTGQTTAKTIFSLPSTGAQVVPLG